MATVSRPKSSTAQLAHLSEHMKTHPDMASGIANTLQGRADLERQWLDLSNVLNSLGGPIKTVAKWKQTWRDLRNNVKRKAAHNHREFRGYGLGSTGNGPPTIKELTGVEEQVLSVIGPVAVYGIDDVVETEPTPGPSQMEIVPEPPCPIPVPAEPRVLNSSPTPVSTEPPTHVSPVRPQRKRRRITSSQDGFDKKLLRIEEEKIKLKEQRNAILLAQNDIAKEKNALLNRIADALDLMKK